MTLLVGSAVTVSGHLLFSRAVSQASFHQSDPADNQTVGLPECRHQEVPGLLDWRLGQERLAEDPG